jgi:seryl-tRNA synthetase
LKPKLSEEEEAMNEEEEEMASMNLTEEEVEASRVEAGKDADDAQPVRAEEKKRLDWTGKTYLVSYLSFFSYVLLLATLIKK